MFLCNFTKDKIISFHYLQISSAWLESGLLIRLLDPKICWLWYIFVSQSRPQNERCFIVHKDLHTSLKSFWLDYSSV